MIEAIFHRGRAGIHSVSVSGHAGLAPAGEDILCAGVSTAIQMTANGITEIVEENAAVEVLEDKVTITLPARPNSASPLMLEALYLQLKLMRDDYPQHITVREVVNT
ncbi:MAG: ribosomal-processing cysteine protease Prp [Oscillospiraceae bacterium]|nr:ribosomal-processing cysteine protease Prp [Oscillospiraceae bacterium]